MKSPVGLKDGSEKFVACSNMHDAAWIHAAAVIMNSDGWEFVSKHSNTHSFSTK